ASEFGRVDSLPRFREFFEMHRDDAMYRTGLQSVHETETYDSQHLGDLETWKDIQMRLGIYDFVLGLNSFRFHLKKLVSEAPSQARIVPAALASTRKERAENAIRATYLIEVINALRNRREKVIPKCRFVLGDRPSQFVWSSYKQRFVRRDGE